MQKVLGLLVGGFGAQKARLRVVVVGLDHLDAVDRKANQGSVSLHLKNNPNPPSKKHLLSKHHLLHQRIKVDFPFPPEQLLGLGRVSEEQLDFGGTVVLGVDADADLAGLDVAADFFFVFAFPTIECRRG